MNNHPAEELPPVPASDFGKDHWSLLAYLETCLVDPQDNRLGTARGGITRLPPKHGEFNKERLRCNEERHPLHAVNASVGHWQPAYGTRLAGYWRADESRDPARQLSVHDDWDCLNDLEAAGYIKVMSEANGIFQITDAGIAMAARLRDHKCRGGNFADFIARAAA
jgi:hypothetical protein